MNKKIAIYALVLFTTATAGALGAVVGEITTASNINTAGSLGANVGNFSTRVRAPTYCDANVVTPNCVIPGQAVPSGTYVAFPSGTTCSAVSGGWADPSWTNSTIAGNAVKYCRKN